MLNPQTHKTSQEWEDENPILGLTVGVETDTGKHKRGDDQTRWNDLPYYPPDPAPLISKTSLRERVSEVMGEVEFGETVDGGDPDDRP